MIKKSTLFITISTIALLIQTRIVFAAIGDAINIKINGDIAPHSEVILEASSLFTPLNTANITWLINGEPIEGQQGSPRQRVLLGDLGVPMSITINADVAGRTITKNITILPSLIDTIWEAQTEVPPFYRGKAVPSNDSLVRTLAIPYFGSAFAQGDVSFKWKNGNTANITSGTSQNAGQFLSGWVKTNTDINVTASLHGQEISQKTSVPSLAPQALVYEVSPTQGILTQKAFRDSIKRDLPELTMYAIPFGTSRPDIDNNKIFYTWNVSGVDVQKDADATGRIITLSRNESQAKEATSISIATQHSRKVMQSAKSAFTWAAND